MVPRFLYIPQDSTNLSLNKPSHQQQAERNYTEMARLSLVLLIVIVSLLYHPTCLEARKLSGFEKEQVPSIFKDTFTREEDKGHALGNNERLFAMHLAKIDRILQSTPSPGAGHH
ncbi:hypothetical protein V6N13_129057 [Hibiscus sabdariffa]|uniref:Uncharacterized protein n=1 Tax=Hibiscus sabdariffa TaxID=183260 RepID=A0ABR2SKA5_9ROSI